MSYVLLVLISFCVLFFVFFFKQKTAYEMRISDWSSDVCSSDLDLERAGQPVVRIALSDRYQLGQEFFRWEVAVAVAGAVIGIDPFDQPDVEASKVKTRELTPAYEKTGALPPVPPIFEGSGVKLFSDRRHAQALKGGGAGHSLESYLKAHLGRIDAGDYLALRSEE